MEATTVEQDISLAASPDPEIETMLAAGVHIGHSRSRRHPAMAPFLWGTRSNIDIIDVTRTRQKLAEALAFLRDAARKSQLILFVGTRPSARALLRAAAEEMGYPYVDGRWIGGTITNFRMIAKRVETLETLEQEQASGAFEKYTKKERLKKEEEQLRLRQNFDGLRRLRRLPDAMVIIGIDHDDLALREAKRMNIPVVALVDTNTNPTAVSYPIPSSDDARPAIAYMLECMKAAIREGRLAGEAEASRATGGTEGGSTAQAGITQQ